MQSTIRKAEECCLAALFGVCLLWSHTGYAQPGPTTNWVEAPPEQENLDSPATAGTVSPQEQKEGAREWLVQRPDSSPWKSSTKTAPELGGTTISAFLLLLAVAGAALWMRRRRQLANGGPEIEAQARLAVLSSTRLGPKSHAVSVTAGGRVMLLGVTEQSVNHLAWLDEPAEDVLLAPDALVTDPLPSHSLDPLDERPLPDDYPGSALRAAAASNAHLANSQDLARFQKLLQGAEQGRGEPQAPAASTPSPASQLAARTQDVLGSAADALAEVTPIVSLRRKRQRRRAAARAPRGPIAPAASGSKEKAPFEGQVAGLQALRPR